MSRLLDLLGFHNTLAHSEPIITATEALQRETVNQYLRDMLATANVEVTRLKFLLDCAPMIEMFSAKDRDAFSRLANMKARYAYIHPKTLAPFTVNFGPRRMYVFPGSFTAWIPMSAMPEGRVIFSPVPPPGIEKL